MKSRRIPLKNRQGEVVARAIVDAEAFDFLSQWTWHLGHGYATRTVYIGGGADGAKFITVHMHRLVFGVGMGGPHIDHINRDRLDNRRANLRIVTRAQQSQNLSPRQGTSRFRGVSRVRSSITSSPFSCGFGRSWTEPSSTRSETITCVTPSGMRVRPRIVATCPGTERSRL